ncbi:MAG: biopolymer transporter ExbD [Kiritimatiellae bacterium]|nr:biopolymer transporter ExbD [Kiritimatiellia bacterium]
MKNLSIISAWLSVVFLLVMIWMIGGTFTSAKGVLFDLPAYGANEGDSSALVAVVFPSARETLVFVDDARYQIDDESSLERFESHLREVASRQANRSLILMVDKRVPTDELMKLASVAKRAGIVRILIAERKAENINE